MLTRVSIDAANKNTFRIFCKNFYKALFKVNESVYIAKSRQRYHKTLNKFLLHVPNHTLKDARMLNYGTI